MDYKPIMKMHLHVSRRKPQQLVNQKNERLSVSHFRDKISKTHTINWIQPKTKPMQILKIVTNLVRAEKHWKIEEDWGKIKFFFSPT